MKRLFQINDSKNKPIKNKDVPHSLGYGITHPKGVLYFESKQEAKTLRNIMGTNFSVANGPDHIGKHGHSSKMRANKPR